MKNNMRIYNGSFDAFGNALYDYHRNKTGFIVIERDDGFIDYDDVAHYFHDFRNWAPIEKEAIKYVRQNILDVGAGAGRVSLYLQRAGKSVTALDNSPLALKVSNLRGIKKCIQSDIVNYRPVQRYDTIILYGNNFGLMQNPVTAVNILNAMFDYTTDNARIIAETLTVYNTKYKPHLDYQKRNRKLKRISGQIRFRIRYNNYSTPYYDYLFVNNKELEDIVKKTKWKIECYIKDAGDAYIAVLTKSF